MGRLLSPLKLTLAAALFASPLLAQNKDVLDIGAGPSSPDNLSPITAGNKVKQWIYPSFCNIAVNTFTQSFPLSLTFTNGNGHAGDTVTVKWKAGGTLSPYVTLPADVQVTDDGTVVDAGSATLSLNGLAPGTYSLRIHTQTSGSVSYTHKSVQISVVVGNSCTGAVFAFYTDDQLADVVDCQGFDVATPTGGTFQIVPTGMNASVALTTNPATFYYSFI